MNIISARYQAKLDDPSENDVVVAVIDSVTMTVPLDPANRHYAEIMRQVAAGTLTIADAD